MAPELKDTPASRINNARTILACKPSEDDEKGGIRLTPAETDSIDRELKAAADELRAQRRIVQIAAASRPAVHGENQDCADFLYALDDRGTVWSLDYAMVIPQWQRLPALPQELTAGLPVEGGEHG